jgi:hypothetical protein
MLLPKVMKLKNLSDVEDFKRKSLKDNIHNLILAIDKMVTFDIIDSPILINFLFPKGVVNGERPLNLSWEDTKLPCGNFFT